MPKCMYRYGLNIHLKIISISKTKQKYKIIHRWLFDAEEKNVVRLCAHLMIPLEN